ncbi:hypothetical protein M011DRAFT_85036 [Sporormia fimetaria CBS 119925]|uniref:Uncharacterized protein n=1 Tax=Sporormia fimetaria CBS 119925 TaxID=1340428 RepID=A0A6A6V7A4_9PLEO|nr:hypothetical protein M011DRAFT_85036 [Sporormia fimetaria CBS 119925]
MDSARKPTKVIQVAPEYAPALHPADVKRQCAFFKEETGADVNPVMRGSKVASFQFFGSGQSVDAAVAAVNKWMADVRPKTGASAAWAKMPAFDHAKWYQEQVAQKDAERREQFKGEAPPGLEYRVTVPWPKELLEASESNKPIDFFGHKLEKLNPIRTEEEVYINLLPQVKPAWQVEIQGHREQNIQRAEERYKNMIRKIITKVTSGSSTCFIVLDDSEGDQVVMADREEDAYIPRLIVSKKRQRETGSFRNNPLDELQSAQLAAEIARALDTIRYERGAFGLFIHLGGLRLRGLSSETKTGDTSSLSTFRNFIEGRGLLQTQKRLATFDKGKHLLEHLMRSDALLEPVKPGDSVFGIVPHSLQETPPTFRASFVLEDPDRRVPETFVLRKNPPQTQKRTGQAHHIVVQVHWTPDEDGHFEKLPPHFYRLGIGQGPKQNINVTLLELSESRGWCFDLESMDAIPNKFVNPAILGFAEGVKLDPKCCEPTSTKPFATCRPSPSTKIVFSRLDRIYAFGIKDTSYRVEATAMWYPKATVPCWGLTVSHMEWKAHLAELETLSPGGGAQWGQGNLVKLFFPEDGISSRANARSSSTTGPGNGLKLLVEKLMELSKIVKAALGETEPTAPSQPRQQPGRRLGDGLEEAIRLIDLGN